MRNIKLVIEYDGTNYHGWQSQRNPLTIQGILEQAISKVTQEPITLYGSGRTDAGVHAQGQVANFHTQTNIPAANLVHAINSHLPPDIAIKTATDVTDSFHARYSAKSKVYRYTVLNDDTASPMERLYSWHIRQHLDLQAIRQAASHLIGTHDFAAFQTKADRSKDSTRTVYCLRVRRKGHKIYLDIEASGFLYNMVRAIVGTLVLVGKGFAKPATVRRTLKSRKRSEAGPTAPPQGLCLQRVKYRSPSLKRST